MNARQFIVPGLLLLTIVVAQFDVKIRALWPSFVALAAVITLRSALSGLLIGAASGVLVLAGGNPISAFTGLFSQHLLPAMQSKWNLSVLIFTLLLGGFAALIERGRGFEAVLNRLLGSGKNSGQRVQLSALGLGLLCFFDGLASSLLTGKALRPLADRTGVSRAKLAYLVDSTSSAVACVAIMSTWIAYQLSMIKEGYAQAGVADVQPFAVFLSSIPLNFYCWFTLLMVFVSIWQNWNPGPMAKAEAEVVPLGISAAAANTEDASGLLRVAIPLASLMLCLLIGLYWNGVTGGFFPITFTKAKDAFGNAQAADILVYSSAIACLVAFVLNYPTIKAEERPATVFLEGMQRFFVPCLILIAAWCLSSTLKQLEASKVLAALLGGNFSPGLLPVSVFLVGVLISFTTGTSWGTMGVLMPLALPIALDLGTPTATDSLLVSATVAAVFSGAVFGDHCSPLSDTTIVSSVACDLEPVEHVRTQLPFALITAGLACLVGFIPAGFGAPPLACLVIGAIIIFFLPAIHQRSLSRKQANG